ncbi:proline-rich domain-containing protein [Streptomyces sp. NPDC014986]|uniref:proline-rich domain-containing protein n=2 Tax=Streptomyces TaxID=1883 RepID=UPI0036FB133B
MARTRGSWTGGGLTLRSVLMPQYFARAVFHPAWIPDSLDPSIERLKRFRIIAGAVASLGVYTFIEGGFAATELLENALTASVVLLFLTPTTVGVMLFVWRRTGTVRQLGVPLFNALKLLLLFIGCVLALVLLVRTVNSAGGNFAVVIGVGLTMMWMLVFVAYGAVRVSGNFFGTAAVHRCLPALLATVTSWLMAIPDLVTGDLHGLGLTLGIVFILGAPVTVTLIALVEMGRLKRRYGIRLGAHPASLPPVPGPVPPGTGLPHLPPQGNPYGHPHPPTTAGNPYGPGAGGHPYTTHPQPPPYHPRNPHGPYGG